MHALPELPPRPRLAFAETETHVRQILLQWTMRRLDAAVALAPDAASAFRAAGRPYLALEDGYDPARLCDLANPILDAQQSWANKIFMVSAIQQVQL